MNVLGTVTMALHKDACEPLFGSAEADGTEGGIHFCKVRAFHFGEEGLVSCSVCQRCMAA
jgi:hypothetical protein